MACTGTAVNEFQAGPFNSQLAPETYVSDSKGPAFPGKIFQVFKTSFITPCDERQQFLDIGCGTGDFTRDWILPSCEPCKRIVAVDNSEIMLKYAREKYAHEKIAYEQLDIDDDVSAFLKKHGAFHRVYSFRTLQWSRDLSGALRNIADLLVPGGECLLYFFARNFVMESFRELSHLEPWSKYADVLLRGIPPSQDILDKKGQHAYVSAALSSAGLVPYTTEVLTNTPRSPRLPDFPKGLFLVANPIFSLLSEEEKTAFLETLSTKLPEWYDSYCKKSGPIQASSFLVHARKPEF